MKGYRTVVINGVVTLVAIAAEVADVPGLEHLIGEDLAVKLIAGVAIVNIALRFLTTTPVGRKG
ncbi:hypothetical protein IWQ55_000295 [Labrenzia sp. EL_208]|nr:hypothetical protein [Labrenzia sp. EL_132]MBG6227103.1 hypothetical protein [Labrenzia sp. EL_208]